MFKSDWYNILGPGPQGEHPERRLPFRDASFTKVISRHSSFCAAEVARVLQHGGTLVTQQLGGTKTQAHVSERDHLLDAPPSEEYWSLRPTIEAAGLHVIQWWEADVAITYRDIGALVVFFLVVPWAVPDFTVDTYRTRLYTLHQRIQREGGLVTHRGYEFGEVYKA